MKTRKEEKKNKNPKKAEPIYHRARLPNPNQKKTKDVQRKEKKRKNHHETGKGTQKVYVPLQATPVDILCGRSCRTIWGGWILFALGPLPALIMSHVSVSGRRPRELGAAARTIRLRCHSRLLPLVTEQIGKS